MRIMDCIIIFHGAISTVGMVANGCLGLTLADCPNNRSRSPLLFGLILADLLVCCVTAPITAALHFFSESCSYVCTCFALFLQTWPISVSNLSMMAISLDRCLTINVLRPVNQITGRRPILYNALVATWLSAALFSCIHLIPKNAWKKALVLLRVLVVYLMPTFIVIISHLGIRTKLTTISLTERAKHGELPLPMPLLRRPSSHVIIVAGRPKPNRSQSVEIDIEDPDEHPTDILRSRKHMAMCLFWASVFYFCCWLPYIVCIFCDELFWPASPYAEEYSLWLGCTHSAFNPIFYWYMNYKWLPPPKLCRYPFPILNRSPSSTNEAALGPFNPIYTRQRPVAEVPPERRSSNYLF